MLTMSASMSVARVAGSATRRRSMRFFAAGENRALRQCASQKRS
jgi:hypothetical protein